MRGSVVWTHVQVWLSKHPDEIPLAGVVFLACSVLGFSLSSIFPESLFGQLGAGGILLAGAVAIWCGVESVLHRME